MRSNDERLKRKVKQQKLQSSRKSELEYARKLRTVAKQVHHIIQGFAPNGVVKDHEALRAALVKYAEVVKPWAKQIAYRMLADVSRRDLSMWIDLGKNVGRDLREEIENTQTGRLMEEALRDQVQLISSLPLEAGQRVHDWVMIGLSDSTRAKEVAAEIMRSGKVTQARANLIARTEVSRTATELTKARATVAGISHYVWRTAGDADVRQSHREMNGKVIAFDHPPEVEPGQHYHAGSFPNCRCYPEPIIPEE